VVDARQRANSGDAHPELEDEQAYVDHAYRCLRAMRARAEAVQKLEFVGLAFAEVGVVDNKAWAVHTQRRVDELADTPAALCFGRIDPESGERWYIGRRHVEDDAGDPVVVDWRTPVSTPFYRATIADPLGLRLRRRFLVEGRHLADVFDEDFTDPDTVDAGAYVPDPLLAELERARTGEMRDIVATIQAEQDVIIRAPIGECIVVQGGPGTGKTAVGLHRAAFLLYEHRERLELERLLVVGPNRLFLRYISQVLPSLGETASIQLTLEGLAGSRFTLRGDDAPEVARVKGDGRMAEVVRRAVFDRISVPKDDTTITTRFGTVTLSAEDVAGLVEAATGANRPVNVSREVLREQLLALAWRIQAAKLTADPAHQAGFLAEARAHRALKRLLDTSWPAMTGAAVVRRLLGSPTARRRAADGLLSRDEQALIARTPAGRVSEEPWTRADLGLLDEADTLVSGGTTTYGHVVVDEAQDLSAMELRMVARRSKGGSMTVLGDLAQATSPAAQVRWEEAVVHLGTPKVRVEELEVGYRVPAPILEYANRLLPEAAPHLRPSRSVRLKGEAPRVVAARGGDLAAVAAREVAALVAGWTSVGVVGPASLLDGLATALGDAGLGYADARRGAALGDHITLLPPPAVKGLEFDAVVVVEPASVVAEEASGVRILYVALTRAVQRLTVVHAMPLPAALAVVDA